MLQPAMGDAAAAPAAANAAGASDVAAAMGLQAAGAHDAASAKPRQTLNDIATIATAQLTQHQGELLHTAA